MELWRFLKKHKLTLILHHAGVGISNMASYGAASWITPFFIRTHGWNVSKIGLATGLVVAIGGTAGLMGGGLVGDAVMRWGAHFRLVVCAVAVTIAAIFGILFPMTGDPTLAIVFYGGVVMFGTLPMGVANAALQFLTPSEVRGSVSSIYFCVLNLVTALGPTIYAVVADHVFPSKDGLRYAIATVLPICLLLSALAYSGCAIMYKQASRSV